MTCILTAKGYNQNGFIIVSFYMIMQHV